MTRREDFFAALTGRRPRQAVPIWEIEFQAWDAVSGRRLVLGREFESLTAAQQDKAMHTNAEILLAVCREFDYTALTAPNGYWYSAPGQLAYYVMPGDTRFRQTEILRKLAGDDLVLVGHTIAVLGADYSEEYCVRMFEDPRSVDEQAETVLRDGIAIAGRLHDCGVEVALAASDMADNSGPFYSPLQMERWIYPNLQRWSAAIHEMGMYCILHTDGQLTAYVDRIAETGLDALQAIDPTAGMDMRKTKDIVGGRMGLCGNIDCARLLLGTPQEIYRMTEALLKIGVEEGGLVLGASNAVQSDVPLENYRAMIQAWKDHGACGC